MHRKRMRIQTAFNLVLLSVYFLAGFVLEFTHQHSREFLPAAEKHQEFKTIDVSDVAGKIRCTACRLSRERLSLELKGPFIADVSFVTSYISWPIELTCFADASSVHGSRAPPASN